MAALPSVYKILRQDVSQFPDYVNQLLLPLNQNMGAVYSALNGNLSLGTNVAWQIKQLTFTTSSIANPDGYSGVNGYLLAAPLTFTRTLGSKASSCVLGQILLTNSINTVIYNPVGITSWQDVSGTIYIYHISGLSAATQYTITVNLF